MMTPVAKNGGKENLWKIIATLAATFASVSVAITGYSVQHLHELEVQVEITKNNRFTSTEGKEVWTKLYDLQRQVDACPKKVPPEWFEKKVNILEMKLDAIQAI